MMRSESVAVGDGVSVDVITVGRPGGGPVVAVLGGVHGDELEGVVVTRMLAADLGAALERDPTSVRGSVRVVPVANPAAFAARQRCTPIDGENLARVFPGDPQGTLTHRIAAVLTEHVISGADLLVDLHSAGQHYSMPVFAGCVTAGEVGARSLAATEAFAAPLRWLHEHSNPGRSLTAAEALEVPSVYVEGSGGGGLIGRDLDVYMTGLARVLAWAGVIASPSVLGGRWDAPAPAQTRVLRGHDGNVDASLAATSDGLLLTRVEAGDEVRAGADIGEIVGDDGRVRERIVAPTDGTVMMLRRRAETCAGDGVVMLGPIGELQQAAT